MSVGQFIGALSTGIGFFSFGSSLFPPAPDNSPSTRVRIAVGLEGSTNPQDPDDKEELTGPGGKIGSVRIYNNNEEFLSASEENVDIGSGEFYDFTLTQGNNQQAPYVQVRLAEGSSLCIAYVTVTFADGQHRGWDGG
jgi:hypothetical protein